MKKYTVNFSFDDEFIITFQNGENEIISFSEFNSSSNSKDNFFKKIKDGEKKLDSPSSFVIDQKIFSSLDDLIKELQTKGERVRFNEKIKKEQKLEEVINYDKCDGTGEQYNKDRYGEPLPCPYCDGSGKIKIWK